ncbi:UxaA family hydrolase [Desulfosporosinus sp. SB140]|uniref:UxaA family hydrolase n=1 Tax=Desulfosporosinus paludis TaxID=3115649 RepID=UPI00388D61DC
MKIKGYRRSDGRVGIRNHVLILPTCVCSSETCRVVASQVQGTVTFTNQNGCGQVQGDLKITQQILAGLSANPNVYGTVLIGLGCENNIPDHMIELIKSKTNKPLRRVVIQEEGGTISAVKKSVQYARELLAEASRACREECDLTELIVGTECGGSDPTSGIGSNPVVGYLSDQLIALGASSILSETTEFIGAEHILAARGATLEVSQAILHIVKRYEDHLKNVGESLRGGNPSPGNKVGGITTLEEKSLGCIHKGGSTPVVEVVNYAETPTKKGLVIMDTPGHDVASITGMVAGGCQLVVFTTGRGTPTGNPIAPVIKITANKFTYETMKDNIDFDASPTVDGTQSIEEMGEKLLAEVISIAEGKITKAEVFGFNEIAINRLCNYV